MLVLSRKLGETIQIGNNITVEVKRVSKNRVVLCMDAPSNVRIIRSEIVKQFVGNLTSINPDASNE